MPATPVQRFNVLTDETNIAITDFQAENLGLPLNASFTDIEATEAQAAELLGMSVDDLPKQAETPKDKAARTARDLFSSARDLSKLSKADIDKQFGDMLPNDPALKNLYNKISSQCRSKALKGPKYGKPFGPTVKCGDKTTGSRNSCNSGSVSDFYDKLTGGQLKAGYNNADTLLKRLVGLSAMGYDFNMCGVFSALAGDMPTIVKGRGAAAVLGILSGQKNTKGIFDLAGAQVGLGTKFELPSAASKVFSGFKMPFGTKSTQKAGLGESALGSADLYDDSWRETTGDDLRLNDMGGYNSDLNTSMMALSNTQIPNSSNLNDIPTDDNYFASVAYQGQDFSNASSFV